MLDQVRVTAALDAVAELFAACASPEEEVLAAEQVHLFTSLLRTGAVICPDDLPGALRAMRETAPELPIPDPSMPDVIVDGDDLRIGGAGRPCLYLAVDNTATRSAGDPEGGQTMGAEQAPPTGTP